jgi:hypothetical protein
MVTDTLHVLDHWCILYPESYASLSKYDIVATMERPNAGDRRLADYRTFELHIQQAKQTSTARSHFWRDGGQLLL